MTNDPLAHPEHLVDLVQPQPGAVVSNTLVKSKEGTVTMFAFDVGEGLSEHTAPFDALVMDVEGRATVTVGDMPHAMTPGQMLRLPAGIPHAVHAETPFKMLLIMIRAPRD